MTLAHPDRLLAVVDRVRRAARRLSLELAADGWWLRIGVPLRAEAMLDELLSMAPASL